MKLAEALVLRKHLTEKVDQLKPIYVNGQKGLFETKTERRTINEQNGVDEIAVTVPKVNLEEVTKEYDKYSKALRELDTAIQATNWTTDLVGGPDTKDLKV